MQFLNDLVTYPFLQYAAAAALLSSVAAGIIGSLIVVRRSTYIAGAIAHCVLGGIGLARFAQIKLGLEWFSPLGGALSAALLAACIISWAVARSRERLDSILSVIWSLGMAVGLIFIMKSPGYSQDLMGYLFGSILLVSTTDLVLMAVLDIIIVAAVLVFYNRLLAVNFHEEAALVRGIPVELFTFLLMVVTALTIVLLSQIVGIVLVIALLSIPGAISSRFTHRLSTMMAASTGISLLACFGGLALSYSPELPVGATIILIAGLLYCLTLLAEMFIKRKL